MEESKVFEIWQEGFAIIGSRAKACFIGRAEGKDFLESCLNYKHPKGDPLKLDTNPDGTIRLSSKGQPMSWACIYYDNESDARKGFG